MGGLVGDDRERDGLSPTGIGEPTTWLDWVSITLTLFDSRLTT